MKQSKKKRLCWIINLKNKQMKKIIFLLLLSISVYGQTTGTALKTQIDTDITNKTGNGSISKTNVGGNLKAVVDYVDQQVPIKTAGGIEATNISLYEVLIYDLNTVTTTGATDKVVLPNTTVMGKEILVFASNNANAFTVRGNQAGTAVLSPNGVSSQSTSVSIAANVSYRFIHLGGGYWKAELM